MDAAQQPDPSRRDRPGKTGGSSRETVSILRAIRESGLFEAGWYIARHPEAVNDPIAHYAAHRNEAGFDPNPLFDTGWYLSQRPDAGRAGSGPLLHFLTDGGREGVDPHPLFDTAWYLACHPEVAATGKNPLVHYLRAGAQLGHDPHPLFDTVWYSARFPGARENALLDYLVRDPAECAAPHALFDATWYLRQLPEAVARSGVNLLLHYVTEGAKAGLSPNPLFDAKFYCGQVGEAPVARANPLLHYLKDRGERDPHPLFCASRYVANNPEVQGRNPLLHYVTAGGRLDPHQLFDVSWYLQRNPDVAASGQNPLIHFVVAGGREGRDPHPLFDIGWYRSRAPGLGGMNPLLHYVEHGVREVLDPHPLFDAGWYRARHPELRADEDPLVDYIVRGRDAGSNPHPLFDTSWYLERNRDVAASGQNPLVHFVAAGGREERDPHPLFDTSWYLECNPDVVGSGRNPLVHFMADGGFEGRNPHPLFVSSWYLESNPDVAASGRNPLAHFVADGEREGRDPHPLFDVDWYRSQVPEFGETNSLVHYVEHGIREVRDPHPLFAAKWYRARHPELRSDEDPLIHYIDRGKYIGSEPHPLFDGGWYLLAYPELADGYETPLHHYLRFGVEQLRDPSPDFSTRWYLDRNPDVARAGLNPLAHFAVAGRAEGRAPLPLEALHARRVAAERVALAAEIRDIHRHIGLMVVRPHFVVLIGGADTPDARRTRNSLERQIYANAIAHDAKRAAIDALRGTEDAYLLWLEAGDELPPRALYDLACQINRDPGTDLIYGDEEVVGAHGVLPFFKPGWSPDYAEAFDYVGRAACYRGAAVADLLAEARSAFELPLRLGEAGASVRHLRRMLLRGPDRRHGQDETERALIAEHLARTGRAGGRVEAAPDVRCYAVVPRQRDETVSIVARLRLGPAGEEARSVEAFVHRIAAIGEGSDHENLDVIAVLDAEVGRAERAALEAAGCRAVIAPGGSANAARQLNDGARAASGPILLFLDPALKPVQRSWIERMLMHLDKPAVAAVGARLVGMDGCFHHAGIVSNAGHPEPVCEGNGGEQGYFFSASAARNFLAVSGACLMTRADAFRQAGGFDERLGSALWDVDYCLGRRAAGSRIVYEPGAVLADTMPHRPARTRDDETEHFARRWGAQIAYDPYYNAATLRLGPPTYDGRAVP